MGSMVVAHRARRGCWRATHAPFDLYSSMRRPEVPGRTSIGQVRVALSIQAESRCIARTRRVCVPVLLAKPNTIRDDAAIHCEGG